MVCDPCKSGEHVACPSPRTIRDKTDPHAVDYIKACCCTGRSK